jgi:tetratricopeptide (TPR) repeat protein
MGDHKSALEAFNQALKIDKNYKEAIYGKGNELRSLGK